MRKQARSKGAAAPDDVEQQRRASCEVNGRGCEPSGPASAIGSNVHKQHKQEEHGAATLYSDLTSWSNTSDEEAVAEMIAVESLLSLDAGRIRKTGAVFLHGGVPIVQKRVLRRARSSLLHEQPELGKRRPRRNAAAGTAPPLVSTATTEHIPVRSKRGRAQLLPSKFQDSILVQWKKKKSRR